MSTIENTKHYFRYPGVYSFNTEQESIFFGRNKEIDKLLTLIEVEQQILLYSKSGAGKTSLLNAGIIPKLPNNFEVISLRFRASDEKTTPTERIIQILKENYFRVFHDQTTIIDNLINDTIVEKTLWYYLKKLQFAKSDKTFVFIFDQFEELFTYSANEIEQFKTQLYDLINPKVPKAFDSLIEEEIENNPGFYQHKDFKLLQKPPDTKTVFSIRSDRLSLLNILSDKIPNIQKDFYELKPLGREQAIQAITEPAKKGGDNYKCPAFEFEPMAIDKIIDALTNSGTQTIETTQLQIVCHRIEENLIASANANGDSSAKSPSGFLTLTERDIPDFKDIFKEYYHNAIDKLPENERKSARVFIEDELIKNEQRISLDEGHCIGKISKEILNTLVRSHLLRCEKNSLGRDSYELSHDTLVEPILEDKEERKLQRQKIAWFSMIAAVGLLLLVVGIFFSRRSLENRYGSIFLNQKDTIALLKTELQKKPDTIKVDNPIYDTMIIESVIRDTIFETKIEYHKIQPTYEFIVEISGEKFKPGDSVKTKKIKRGVKYAGNELSSSIDTTLIGGINNTVNFVGENISLSNLTGKNLSVELFNNRNLDSHFKKLVFSNDTIFVIDTIGIYYFGIFDEDSIHVKGGEFWVIPKL